MNIPLTPLEWTPAWRIIPSKFPPQNLFSRIADAEDYESLFELEGLTNDRLRVQRGEHRLDNHFIGPEPSSLILSAFCHPNPIGSRFSNGSYGVYYCAYELDTAVAETTYHRCQFLKATKESPGEIDMRVLLADLLGDLHDLRDLQTSQPQLFHKTDYQHSQTLGGHLKKEGSKGIVYPSVRHEGECAAVFCAHILNNCRQERHLCYVWDGQKIAQVYEKRDYSKRFKPIVSSDGD